MLSLRAEEEQALLTSSLAKAKVMQEHFLHQCSKGSPGAHLLKATQALQGQPGVYFIIF